MHILQATRCYYYSHHLSAGTFGVMLLLRISYACEHYVNLWNGKVGWSTCAGSSAHQWLHTSEQGAISACGAGRQAEQWVGQMSIQNELMTILLNIFSSLSADSTLDSTLDQVFWWLNLSSNLGYLGVSSKCQDLISVLWWLKKFNKSTVRVIRMQIGLAMYALLSSCLTWSFVGTHFS